MAPRAQRISANVSAMALSAIKEMAMRAAAMDDVASLAWGLPSFETPAPIRAAVREALGSDREIGKYALPDGLAELRRLAAQTHGSATGIEPDADREVLITAGNMQGINALLHVLLDPGDEVIITDPGFASHIQQVRLCGGAVVPWPMDESRGWALDVDALPGLIGDRTRAIIIVSPSNPTGTILAERDLRTVGALAREHGLMVLLDDPYSHFVYEPDARAFNLASVAGLREHVVYLFTFSKAYAMSGWRLGYMVLPPALKAEVLKVHDATLICTPRISQVAGIAALSGPADHLERFRRALARRRDRICDRLDRLAHVFAYARPGGAYYVFPRILVEHADSRAFALDVLEQARVSVTPGGAFGARGDHHVRMAYCVSEETIDRAFDRLEALFGA